MIRRRFIKRSVAVGALPFIPFSPLEAVAPVQDNTFKLNYAPHFGMFEASAGSDLLDQLQFMYDQGFRSLEDNGMKGRPVEVQASIASKMNDLGMDMGVFVAH